MTSNLAAIAEIATTQGETAARRFVEQVTGVSAWARAFESTLTNQHGAAMAVETPDDSARRFAKELHRIHTKVAEVRDIQGQPGNWNFSDYMRGMFNGLELAVSILEDEREPQYRGEPEDGYLCDRPPHGPENVVGPVVHDDADPGIPAEAVDAIETLEGTPSAEVRDGEMAW